MAELKAVLERSLPGLIMVQDHFSRVEEQVLKIELYRDESERSLRAHILELETLQKDSVDRALTQLKAMDKTVEKLERLCVELRAELLVLRCAAKNGGECVKTGKRVIRLQLQKFDAIQDDSFKQAACINTTSSCAAELELMWRRLTGMEMICCNGASGMARIALDCSSLAQTLQDCSEERTRENASPGANFDSESSLVCHNLIDKRIDNLQTLLSQIEQTLSLTQDHLMCIVKGFPLAAAQDLSIFHNSNEAKYLPRNKPLMKEPKCTYELRRRESTAFGSIMQGSDQELASTDERDQMLTTELKLAKEGEGAKECTQVISGSENSLSVVQAEFLEQLDELRQQAHTSQDSLDLSESKYCDLHIRIYELEQEICRLTEQNARLDAAYSRLVVENVCMLRNPPCTSDELSSSICISGSLSSHVGLQTLAELPETLEDENLIRKALQMLPSEQCETKVKADAKHLCRVRPKPGVGDCQACVSMKRLEVTDGCHELPAQLMSEHSEVELLRQQVRVPHRISPENGTDGV